MTAAPEAVDTPESDLLVSIVHLDGVLVFHRFANGEVAVDVEGLFIRGKEAADRGNYDYAIEIFSDALHVDPGHRNTRIALRGCEMERFRDRGAGIKAKLIALGKGFVPLCMMLAPGSNAEKTMTLCERYLANDPTSLFVLKRLANACAHGGYIEAAADTLEFARQRAPKNIGVLRSLGEMRHQLGEYDKSVRCFREIIAIKPEDRTAAQRAKEISAESHLKRSHLEDSDSFRETLRDANKARELEQEGHLAQTAQKAASGIAQLQQAAAANPGDAKAQHDLGDACMQTGQYIDAEKAYKKAFEIDKRFSSREKLGNARIRHLEQIERKAVAAAEDSGVDPRLKGVANEARRKRLEFCVKEFAFRRKHHPTNMKLAQQLGEYYFELGGDENIQNAIQQFQQALSSPSLKLRSQLMLGRCFAMNTKTLDMAKATFEAALALVEDTAGETAKTITYELASAAEKLGNQEEALSYYKKIFVVDAGFRDVAQKIQTMG